MYHPVTNAPLDMDIDETKSITQLMATKKDFKDFGKIWLNHLKESKWADIGSVEQNLENDCILVPAFMIAYKKVGGMFLSLKHARVKLPSSKDFFRVTGNNTSPSQSMHSNGGENVVGTGKICSGGPL